MVWKEIDGLLEEWVVCWMGGWFVGWVDGLEHKGDGGLVVEMVG